jgi:hypothetical protein
MLAPQEVSPIVIRAEYDEEARVWVAQSEEIPLVTEAETYEILLRKLPDLIQDVLDENADPRMGTAVPFSLVTQSHATPRVHAV